MTQRMSAHMCPLPSNPVLSTKNKQMEGSIPFVGSHDSWIETDRQSVSIRLPHREQRDFALHSGVHTDLSSTCPAERSPAEQAYSLYGVRPLWKGLSSLLTVINVQAGLCDYNRLPLCWQIQHTAPPALKDHLLLWMNNQHLCNGVTDPHLLECWMAVLVSRVLLLPVMSAISQPSLCIYLLANSVVGRLWWGASCPITLFSNQGIDRNRIKCCL